MKHSMMELTKLDIIEHQQVLQPNYNSRVFKPSYFKIRKGTNTAPQLNTRIVELKGVGFDHFIK